MGRQASMSHMYVENQTMKVRNFLLGGLMLAAIGFMAPGCNENPTDTPVEGAPKVVRDLQAVSLSETSVGLKWTAPESDGITGTISYRVSWHLEGNAAADSGSVDVAGTSATMTVQAGKEYDFEVVAVRGGKASTAVGVHWAGATRYGKTVSIKVYEDESAQPSGLTLDPSLGGPKVVSVSSSNPNLRTVQLAIYTVAADPSNFIIGPAYAITEYQNADSFDVNTHISDSAFATPSLDGFYLNKALTTWFASGNGNKSAFTLPIAQSTNGQVFFVRTGAAATDQHFARIFVKNVSGKMLQGTAPNRFVELEISYQSGANLPYAKAVPGKAAAVANIGAKRTR